MRLRWLNDDLAQSKEGVNAVWIKHATDSKINRQSALSLDRKHVHKMSRDSAMSHQRGTRSIAVKQLVIRQRFILGANLTGTQ